MPILPGEPENMRDFLLRHVGGETPALSSPFPVDAEHQPLRCLVVHIEKALQNTHDKFHGSIVVV